MYLKNIIKIRDQTLKYSQGKYGQRLVLDQKVRRLLFKPHRRRHLIKIADEMNMLISHNGHFVAWQ